MRRASIVVDLKTCNKKCLFFYQGEGNGHCEDWCDCKKYGKRLHEYNNDIRIPFPDFCKLPEISIENEGSEI